MSYRTLPDSLVVDPITSNSYVLTYGFYNTSTDVSTLVANITATINEYIFANSSANVRVYSVLQISRFATIGDAQEGPPPTYTYQLTPNISLNFGATSVSLYNSLSSTIVAGGASGVYSNGSIVVDTFVSTTLPLGFRYNTWALTATITTAIVEPVQTFANTATRLVNLQGPNAIYFGMNF
jgi:hypothetical protein